MRRKAPSGKRTPTPSRVPPRTTRNQTFLQFSRRPCNANQNEGMAHAPLHSAAESGIGVKLLVTGVALVLLAQLWSAVPMAAAIALVAWGTVLNVSQRRELLILAAVIYTPLGILAVMSQVDLAMESSLAWGLFAGLDAALAITLLYHLACRTGDLLARK